MIVGGPEDLSLDGGPEGRQVHRLRHGRYLGQRHGVRHAVYKYEDPDGLAADDQRCHAVTVTAKNPMLRTPKALTMEA